MKEGLMDRETLINMSDQERVDYMNGRLANLG